MKIILLADIHWGAKNNDDEAHRLSRYIKKRFAPRDHIIFIAGDLMDTPSSLNAWQVGRWIEGMRKHGFRVYAVPGNHDLFRSGLDLGIWSESEMGLWSKHIDPVLSWDNDTWPRTAKVGDLHIIGINTQEGSSNDAEIDLAQGCVGQRQQAEVTILLQEPKNIVIGHHKVRCDDVFHLLEDAEDMIDIMSNRVIGYVCGHLHQESRIDEGGLLSQSSRRSTQREHGRLEFLVLSATEGLPLERIAFR